MIKTLKNLSLVTLNKYIDWSYILKKKMNIRAFSNKYISNLSFTSDVFDLGLFGDFNKKSVGDRAELSRIYPNAFVNFFFMNLRAMVTLNIISKGFINIMEENTCFPNISLFFFRKCDLDVIKNYDFKNLNSILENRSNYYDNEFLFKEYNIIYWTSISSAVCWNKSNDDVIKENLYKDLLYSITCINSVYNNNNNTNNISIKSNIYLVYHITFDSDNLLSKNKDN
uniref:Uncharacterized protein n=1 Tax=Arthrobotrys musiformis TaxID=47236 RepID=A0A482EBC9_9PEZI|nr:hypothetical protein [Arthrobotrys musiformis]QBM31532.1 hypothetical protein [Arthrobotrys musiformis]QBM31682.1 hypothetical protein [Arthrobotrys musiformis]